MSAFWTKLVEQLETGERAFLALVADNTDHSPGTRGARMFVTPSGETRGTIGGGVMEGNVVDRAREALESGEFEATCEKLYHRPEAPGELSGMICQGTQTNIYYLCDPARDLGPLREAVRRQREDDSGVLVFSPEGVRVEEGDPDRDRPHIALSDDDYEWSYREQLLNWKRAAIIGGGHCGLALSRALNNLGYTVTVFETRPDIFTLEENAAARHKIIVDDYAEAASHIRHPDLTHMIVMTADQPSDVRGLFGILTSGESYPYIGVMGSAAKIHKIRKDLDELGVPPGEFDRVEAPIGLEMTSNTPEEIAISVSAELLQKRTELFPHAP